MPSALFSGTTVSRVGRGLGGCRFIGSGDVLCYRLPVEIESLLGRTFRFLRGSDRFFVRIDRFNFQFF